MPGAPTASRDRIGAHLAHRRDIDGLRTLAVLPVVLNHAGVRGFWGGYVGVDIFFVISGFLITGIIVKDLEASRHTIANFYRRRVLRIFPALFVLLAVVTAAACLTMLPGELVRYARSLGATTLFGSNILFFNETGYFKPASQIKPLLHTWSLAIEEQFYLVWPLLLAAVGVLRPLRLRLVVGGLTLVSFALAVWMVRTNASAAFFLIPARAWELSLGALVALVGNPVRRRWANELLAAIGLAMILIVIRKYDETTPFPGLAAVPPCLGASLLILTGARGTLVGRLLSLWPIVFIGQISYSLYLWHWPVIVFADIGLFLPKTGVVIAGEVLLSIVLATLSWWFVERPFRVGVSGWRTSYVLLGGAGAMIVLLLVTVGLIATQGLPERFTPSQQAVAKVEELDGDSLYRSGTCFAAETPYDAAHCLARHSSAPSLVLLGDSHAAHLWPGLSKHLDRFDVLQATMTGCKPVLYPPTARQPCAVFFRDMLTRWIPAHSPSVLVLSARWRMSDLPLVRATLSDPGVRAAHPVLVGPAPQYTTALPRLLVFADRRGEPDLPRRAMDPEVIQTDRALRDAARAAGVPYISMLAALCSTGPCRTWAGPGRPIQFDYGHFTAAGSSIAVDAILPQIEAAAR